MKQNFAFYLYLVTILSFFPSYALTDSYKEFIDGKNIICGVKGNDIKEVENKYFVSFTSTKAINIYVGRIGDEYKQSHITHNLTVSADILEWKSKLKQKFTLDRSTLILTIKDTYKGGEEWEMQCEVITSDELNHLISVLIKKEQKQYNKRRVMNKI